MFSGDGAFTLYEPFLKSTHLYQTFPTRDIGKHCRPRSDAAKCDVWSGSTLFVFNTGISTKEGNIKKNNWTSLLLKMGLSREL